jgi:hypothetical protein
MEKITDPAPFRRFSAIAPLVMSVGAFIVVMVAVNIDAPGTQADEGAAAHLFQLLMAGQAPIVAYFAIKWLPRDPVHALFVLGTQAFAAAVAMAPVLWFGL